MRVLRGRRRVGDMTGVTRHVTCHELCVTNVTKFREGCNYFEGSIAVIGQWRGAFVCSCRKLNNFHFNNFPLPFSLLPFCVEWSASAVGWRKNIPLARSPYSCQTLLSCVQFLNTINCVRWETEALVMLYNSQIITEGRGYVGGEVLRDTM